MRPAFWNSQATGAFQTIPRSSLRQKGSWRVVAVADLLTEAAEKYSANTSTWEGKVG